MRHLARVLPSQSNWSRTLCINHTMTCPCNSNKFPKQLGMNYDCNFFRGGLQCHITDYHIRTHSAAVLFFSFLHVAYCILLALGALSFYYLHKNTLLHCKNGWALQVRHQQRHKYTGKTVMHIWTKPKKHTGKRWHGHLGRRGKD